MTPFMSMSTQEALDYIKKAKESSTKEESKVEATPSVEETQETSKSADTNADTPEDKVDNKSNDKAETTAKEDKGSDEPKSDKVEVKNDETTEPKSKFPELSKRDYAFIREKQKRKDMKQKYEARIKELEEQLSSKQGLKAEHFVNQDGTPNSEAYVNWKFKERDMQDEIQRIRKQNEDEQLQYDLERDRIITEHCFPNPQDLKEYNDMISRNGKAFGEAVSERDPNGVVFGYLETLNEYPIVLKELMDLNKNPRLLQRVFRSTDPDALKKNIAIVADEILEKHYAASVQPQTQVQPQSNKPALPVIGKQITNNSSTVEPVVKDRNYWVNYSKTHQRYR